MAEQMRQGFCQECNKYTLVKRGGISHILHLLLSVFTIGLWVLVWIALAIFNIGGWRCQACGGDKIKDTGEMLSVRGWLVIALVAVIFLPLFLTFGGGAEGGTALDAMSPFLSWVPILAVPILGFMAVQRRKRQSDRVNRPRDETLQPEAPQPEAPRSAASPDRPASFITQVPPGMTVSEDYTERAESDTSAADEFRKRMQQQRD